MPVVEREGYKIRYHVEGSGETVIFLHSLGTCLELWNEQFQAFKGEYQVVAVDFAGHGQSDSRMPFTIEDAALDVIRVMDALKVDQAHIVGISMGGHVAMELHRKVANRIQSMLLADTWVYMPPDVREERTRNRIDRLHAIDMEQFSTELAKNSLSTGATPDQIARLQSLIQCSKETYESAWHAVQAVDFRDELGKIQWPVCILVGDEDKSTPVHYAEEIASLIPQAEWDIVPNGGHLSHLTNADFFNRKIREHMKKDSKVGRF